MIMSVIPLPTRQDNKLLFHKTRDWIRQTDDLTATHVAVLYALVARANVDGLCWPSRQTISKDSKVSLGQVGRALQVLQTRNAIERIGTIGNRIVQWKVLCRSDHGDPTYDHGDRTGTIMVIGQEEDILKKKRRIQRRSTSTENQEGDQNMAWDPLNRPTTTRPVRKKYTLDDVPARPAGTATIHNRASLMKYWKQKTSEHLTSYAGALTRKQEGMLAAFAKATSSDWGQVEKVLSAVLEDWGAFARYAQHATGVKAPAEPRIEYLSDKSATAAAFYERKLEREPHAPTDSPSLQTPTKSPKISKTVNKAGLAPEDYDDIREALKDT